MDNEREVLQIVVSSELHKQIKEVAAHNDIPTALYVRELIDRAVLDYRAEKARDTGIIED